MLHRIMILSAVMAASACTLAPPLAPEAPTASAAAPLWSDAAADALMVLSASAPAEGLASYESAAGELAHLQASSTLSPEGAAAFDSAADTLFLDLVRTFAQGALNPTRVDPQWRIPRPTLPDAASLLAMARRDAASVRSAATLLPQSDEYAALRTELARVLVETPGALDPAGRAREARISSLRASLERWRWLPRQLPTPRIEVHVAQLQAILHQSDTPARIHNVIVGARTRQTPAFAAEITAVTFNPSWTPPQRIVTSELLPLFARDPGAASRGGYEAIDASGAIVDPASVSWAARPFPYQVRQRPGPANALGRVKFEMANPYAIYLHDTPNHALFAREERALSHGCVRVDDALDLAAAVLATPSVQHEVDAGRTRTLPLATPLAVYVLYITASNADGGVRYAEDIYRRDAPVVAALDAGAAHAAAVGFTPLLGECRSAGSD